MISKLFLFQSLQLKIYNGFIRYLAALVVKDGLKEDVWFIYIFQGVSFIVAAGCANRLFPSVFNAGKEKYIAIKPEEPEQGLIAILVEAEEV